MTYDLKLNRVRVVVKVDVSLRATTVNLFRMISVVCLEKRYKWKFIVSHIRTQYTVLKMYLDTKYIFHILDTCISDTTRHCTQLT